MMKNIAAATFIGSCWCLGGGLLLVWSVRGYVAWRESVERFSGPRDATLIFACFAATALVAGALLVARVRGARVLIVVLSTLAVLYGGTFVLFGGLDDTGGSYALSVAALAILSIVSFVFRKKLA